MKRVVLFLIFLAIFANAAYKSKVFFENLYKNVFDRNASIEEIEYWKNKTDEGESALRVVSYFYKSKEMNDLNLSNEDFIKKLYLTFLGREADIEGLSYWVSKMDEGYSKEQIFYSFGFSEEFIKRSVKYSLKPYDFEDRLKAFISGFYGFILQRESDDEGMNFWIEKLKNREETPKSVVEFFFFSKEFENKNLSDEEFIKIVYRVILARELEEEGSQFWLEKLKEKGKKWVIDAMTDSEEFKKISKELFEDVEIDILPPPSGLKAFFENNETKIEWNEVKGAYYYKVYRDGEFLGKSQNSFYKDLPLEDGVYEYKITTMNKEEKESAFSDPVKVKVERVKKRTILKTGQLLSYSDFDDGYYKRGYDLNYTRDNENGIVIDNTIGLMWQDNEKDGGVSLPWSEAKEYCENLSLGGYNDWRLPKIGELVNLENFAYAEGWRYSLPQIFQNVDSWKFWSENLSLYSDKQAWVVCYGQGFARPYSTSEKFHARCVRGIDREYLNKPILDRDNEKEVVIDKSTDLMWQDNFESANEVGDFWTAIEYCKNLSLGGYNDWRLPNAKELFFITDREKSSPSIYKEFRNVRSGFYWSSTTYQRFDDEGWKVGFGDGRLEHGKKSDNSYIRCVRDLKD